MRADEQLRGESRDLERQIDERTHGRLHQVRVEMTEDGLIVHGWTDSYHVKRLALQAISDMGDSTTVELDIRVGAFEDGAVGDGSGNSRSFDVPTGLVGRVDAGGWGASDRSESGRA